MDLSGDNAFNLNFDPAFRENHTIKPAGDHHAISFDLTFDSGAFAENHCLLGNNVALDVAVNAERPRQLQRSLKAHTLIDESSPFFMGAIFRRAGPLPSHEFPQRQTLSLYLGPRASQLSIRGGLSNRTPEPMGSIVRNEEITLCWAT